MKTLGDIVCIAMLSAAIVWLAVDVLPALPARVMAEQTALDYPDVSPTEVKLIALGMAEQKAETFGPWKKTVATFYGAFYDSGPGRNNKTSDRTPYRSDGLFCATYLVPLGTTIEVKRGTVTLRLVVRDRPAKVNGHKIDIPTKTWDRFGAKRSVGVLPVEWRVVKK
jgi:3D (Asp-Asp-Asp) domain-containing protein